MLNVGYDNYFKIDKIVCILNKNSAPIKRYIQTAREMNMLIDVSQGKVTKSVIILNDGYVGLSALPPFSLANKLGVFRLIGYDCYVKESIISSVVKVSTNPVRNLINEAKNMNMVIDATFGRPTRSAIITSDNYIILTAKNARTLAQNLIKKQDIIEELKNYSIELNDNEIE